jgi:hypothetical protein
VKFECSEKLAKMKRALARLERIYTNTGNAISTADARDAAEDFVSHAYHFKDYLRREFPGKARQIEQFITSSRALSLIADLQNSLKHACDITNRRERYEKETGASPVGDLVQINSHTTIDLAPAGSRCFQRLEITFRNTQFDALALAREAVEEWDRFLTAEGIALAKP